MLDSAPTGVDIDDHHLWGYASENDEPEDELSGNEVPAGPISASVISIFSGGAWD
jgi:hypothetical protein